MNSITKLIAKHARNADIEGVAIIVVQSVLKEFSTDLLNMAKKAELEWNKAGAEPGSAIAKLQEDLKRDL